MQRALFKKLFRDLWHLRGQLAATAVVVACGVASFVSMRSTYASLLETQQNYYSEYRFGDVFASLTRAPEGIASRIAAVPGVAAVETRIVSDAILDIPDLREPAQGRIVSIPEIEAPILNDLHLKSGRYIRPGRSDEIIVSAAFAEANGFVPGDSLGAIINGRSRRLNIVGIGLSPEYIYEIRGGDIFPDNKRYGIIWMGRDAAEAAYDMKGAFNDLSLTLAPNASEDQVIDQVDRILKTYGGTGSYGRADQQSYRFISNELSQLRTFGTFLPIVFLGVTAFLLHLVMSRLVNTQREQIGLLKAFGYRNTEIGVHFFGLAFISVLGGIILGVLLGIWMGDGMTTMYTEYFRFPILTYHIGLDLLVYSVLITIGSAALGAGSAVRRAVLLPPAEAMRPEAPPSFKPGILETSGLSGYLSPSSRMVARNISRHPLKSMLASLGIAIAAALLFTGFYFYDAIDQIIDIQFRQAIREDAVVNFTKPQTQKARLELADMSGVMSVETFRAVPARLSAEHYSKKSAIIGVESEPDLHRIVDQNSQVRIVSPHGLALSRALANRLGVSKGSFVTVEVLEGRRPVKRVEVTSIIDELMGMNAYMNIRTLNRLMDEDDIISGAYLRVDSRGEDGLYDKLKRIPSISGVGMPKAILESFNDTFAKTIGIFTSVLVLFSSAIVFGVVYNAARIALSERGRELASLRVLGFSKREVASILLGEQAVVTLVAVPSGFVLGVVLCATMNNLVDTELMRLPLVFTIRTFLITGVIVTIASAISALLVTLRLRGLDLIAVLKTRE